MLLRYFAIIVVLVWFAAPARADDVKTYAVTLKGHAFMPAHLDVPAGTRFRISLTNAGTAAAELESYDMKFEKIAVPGAAVAVFAGPLHPGTYKFFDDYQADAVGTVTAK